MVPKNGSPIILNFNKISVVSGKVFAEAEKQSLTRASQNFLRFS